MDQIIITLNEGWRFHYGDVPEAWYRGYDDRDWEEVFLPHDWSVHMPFQKEYSSGTGYLAGGIGWYRLRFSLPEEYRGKHVTIVFDGIYKNSRIWCNSYHLGKRPYGYSEISYDISDFVNFGAVDNEVSVQVTHTDLADSRWFTGSGIYRKVWLVVEEKVHPVLHGTKIQTNWIGWDSTEAMEQWGAEHSEEKTVAVEAETAAGVDDTTETGIVAGVDGAADESAHAAFLVQNGKVYAAELGISAEFANDSDHDCLLQATFQLLDGENHKVTSWKKQMKLPAGETGVMKLKGSVKQPRLWDVDDPYLYTLVTRLSELAPDGESPEVVEVGEPCVSETGEVCAAGEREPCVTGESHASETGRSYVAGTQKIGIRIVRFDPDQGLFLNEKNLKLKGVCVHHDGGCLGAAMYREVWLRRLLKLKEAGCNAIRTSHNPHMPELYDLCDELGLLMMDEAFDEWENPKNKWSTGHNVYPPKHQGYAEDFPQWYEADLTTMIRRDWNHPSIIMWSIGNEIDYPNDPYCHPGFASMVGNNDASKPAAEMMYNPDKPNAERLSVIAARLAGIVKKMDDSRPVTLAAAFPELSSRIGFLDELDVVGYNYKEHLYEQDHVRFPQKPFLGSENGHSYQAWRAVTDHPYISGQFLWTGIDYLGEAHGWPIHGSGAGLLDMAGNEKPGYYSRKAWWRETSYLCLLTAPTDPEDAEGRRKSEWRPFAPSWNYEPGQMVDVYCFTNVNVGSGKMELFLNDRLVGEGTWNETCGRYEWGVAYEPGTLKAVVQGCDAAELGGETGISATESKEPQTAVCVLQTTGPAVEMDAKVWTPTAADCAEMVSSGGMGTQMSGLSAGASQVSESSGTPSGLARVAQIEVSLHDAEGRLAADQDRIICAEVENGILLGLENGDLADLTPYTENWRKTHHGRLILYVRVKEGNAVRVKISCEELGLTKELELA